MVQTWCRFGANWCKLGVQTLCKFGANVVQIWCKLVQTWCKVGASLVQIWCNGAESVGSNNEDHFEGTVAEEGASDQEVGGKKKEADKAEEEEE